MTTPNENEGRAVEVLDLDLLAEPGQVVRIQGTLYPMLAPANVSLIDIAKLQAYGKMLEELSPEGGLSPDMDMAEAEAKLGQLQEGMRLILPELPLEVAGTLSIGQITAVLGSFLQTLGYTARELEVTCVKCGAIQVETVPTVLVTVNRQLPPITDN